LLAAEGIGLGKAIGINFLENAVLASEFSQMADILISPGIQIFRMTNYRQK